MSQLSHTSSSNQHDKTSNQAKDICLSWEKIANDCQKLAAMFDKEKFDGILAVARGGMVPASLIGRILAVKRFEVLVLSSYSDRERGRIKVERFPSVETGRWLIIDELADSGSTALKLREIYPGCKIAVLYVKTAGKTFVDHYVHEYSDSTWLVFPWERIKS